MSLIDRIRRAGRKASDGPLRVAYLTSHYPALSHVFIEREVQGMRAAGVEVITFSVRPTSAQDLLSEGHRRAAASTSCLFELPKVLWLQAHASCLIRDPAAYLSALVSAMRTGTGVRSRSLQYVYFLEAVVFAVSARRRGATHIHVHHANNVAEVARLACILARSEARPWTWSLAMHGSAEFWNVERFQLAAKVIASDLVACISDYTRSQLMALVPAEHWTKLHVIHMGVDPTRYPALGDERRLRPEGTPLRILFVGRIIEAKGLSLLVEAIARLHAAGEPVELRIVGAGPFQVQLEGDVVRRGLAAVVDFRGPLGQDDVLQEYAWADLFCLPSFVEGVPVVLMEAMATELPVVSTHVNGIPELVTSGSVGGILVRPGRVDHLADAFRAIGRDRELALAMGRAGRALVLEEYNSAIEASRLSVLIRSLSGEAAHAEGGGASAPGREGLAEAAAR